MIVPLSVNVCVHPPKDSMEADGVLLLALGQHLEELSKTVSYVVRRTSRL
jgi:hypothetical protein